MNSRLLRLALSNTARPLASLCVCQIRIYLAIVGPNADAEEHWGTDGPKAPREPGENPAEPERSRTKCSQSTRILESEELEGFGPQRQERIRIDSRMI